MNARLESRGITTDLLLDVFKLSRVPSLLDNGFLHQEAVLFLLPQELVSEVGLGKSRIDFCYLSDPLEFWEAWRLMHKYRFFFLTFNPWGQ
jgi:hypothetical protein